MVDTMIERVARALAAEAGYAGGGEAWRSRTDQAARIITAMRKPTDAMEAAGVLPAMSRDPARTWAAMIEAALADEV